MRTLAVFFIAALVGGVGLYFFSRQQVGRIIPAGPGSAIESTQHDSSIPNPGATSPNLNSRAVSVEPIPGHSPSSATNKLERLASLRETFRALAQGGDPLGAMRAARELKDENERETAMLALVTEWTKGELRQPYWRAKSVADIGINAALGMELAAHPELAKLWAEEMTSGEGRTAIYQQVAKAMVGSDPASAFALSDQIPADARAKFQDEIFQHWGRNDTAAAINWANQLPEEDQKAAMKSIRTVAPVGIGAVLRERDHFTVIDGFVPGSPAEMSGQLKPGDRLLAIAQGDGRFMDARELPLSDIVNMVRGAPDTTVQLRVLNEQAPPGSAPRTVTITRGQINFNASNPSPAQSD